MKDLPALEDIDVASVFIISCREDEAIKRHPPPLGDIEMKGTETLALIDTGVTVNVIDMSTLDMLRTRPVVRHTNAKVYPYESTTPLALRGYRRHSPKWHRAK